MNLFGGNGRVPWCLQSTRPKLPEHAIYVIAHHGDDRPYSAIKIAEKNLVAASREHTERSLSCIRRGVSFDILEIEDARVELERFSEPAASNLRNDRHVHDCTT
jgi:hypothetical protein